jgi:hypothetical protein
VSKISAKALSVLPVPVNLRVILSVPSVKVSFIKIKLCVVVIVCSGKLVFKSTIPAAIAE